MLYINVSSIESYQMTSLVPLESSFSPSLTEKQAPRYWIVVRVLDSATKQKKTPGNPNWMNMIKKLMQ